MFDTHTLSVKELELTMRQKLFKILGYFFVALVFFAAALLFSFYFVDSPKEVRLKRDLNKIQQQYKFLNQRVEQLTSVLEDVQGRDDDLYRMIFETEPAKRNTKIYNNYDQFQDLETAELIIQTSLKVDDLASMLYDQSKSFDEVFKLAKSRREMVLCMPAILPINKNEGKVVSGYGPRYHPIFRDLRMHTGIDFSAHHGTPVYATGDGVIEIAGVNSSMSGYGIVIKMNHGFGFKTLYAHLSKVKVHPGQKVKRGDVIGFVGSTGTSTNPHLHYEVFSNLKRVNPVYYFFNDLSPEEYEEVLEKSKEINQSLS